MSFDNKLAKSIQSDYQREAAIERAYGSKLTFKATLVRVVATVASLAVIAEMLLRAAA